MRILVIALTFIWVGLVLGISFIETPLKFKAPEVTTRIGLGIGKIVFTFLNRVEILVALGIVIGLVMQKIAPKVRLLYTFPILILAVQTIWLLPILIQRTDSIFAGEIVPNTLHHISYIVLEIIKVITLLIAGVYFTSLANSKS